MEQIYLLKWGIANKIAKGETITLPLGRKTGLSSTAKNMLSTIIEEKNISDTYVLYTIDDEWSKNNATKLFFISVSKKYDGGAINSSNTSLSLK